MFHTGFGIKREPYTRSCLTIAPLILCNLFHTGVILSNLTKIIIVTVNVKSMDISGY